MNRRLAGAALVGIAVASAHAQNLKVARLAQNPLVTLATSPSLGTNVCEPTVIRVPDWVEHPLGRY